MKIALFIVVFFGLFLQSNAKAETSEAMKKEIQGCIDKIRPCLAQCEGLSKRIDEVEEGVFFDSKTSPRGRCKKVCEQPCDKYLPYVVGDVLELFFK